MAAAAAAAQIGQRTATRRNRMAAAMTTKPIIVSAANRTRIKQSFLGYTSGGAYHGGGGAYQGGAAYHGGSGGGNRTACGENLTPNKLHMRGLPYRVTASQIEDFFAPLRIVEIKLGQLQDGRASGDGLVEFANFHDAQSALSRDRQMIKSRFLF